MDSQLSQIDLDCIYKHNPDIVFRRVLDETFLIRISGNMADMQKIYVLDTVGEFIWNNLDGSTSLDNIHSSIHKEFKADKEQARTDLVEFIDELIQAELISPSD